MEEWQKIFVSSVGGGIAGFFAGVLLEPVKLYFTERHNVAWRRKAVLREIAANYCELKRFLATVEYEPCSRFPNLETTLYEHAKTDVFLFAQIEPSSWIASVYAGFYYVAALNPDTSDTLGRLPEAQAREYTWKTKAACKRVEEFGGVPNVFPPMRCFMKYIPQHLRIGFKGSPHETEYKAR